MFVVVFVVVTLGDSIVVLCPSAIGLGVDVRLSWISDRSSYTSLSGADSLSSMAVSIISSSSTISAWFLKLTDSRSISSACLNAWVTSLFDFTSLGSVLAFIDGVVSMNSSMSLFITSLDVLELGCSLDSDFVDWGLVDWGLVDWGLVGACALNSSLTVGCSLGGASDSLEEVC